MNPLQKIIIAFRDTLILFILILIVGTIAWACMVWLQQIFGPPAGFNAIVVLFVVLFINNLIQEFQ